MSGIRESDPSHFLGKEALNRSTNPASRCRSMSIRQNNPLSFRRTTLQTYFITEFNGEAIKHYPDGLETDR